MEMVDVIKELQNITNKSPEVAKAIDSVTKIATNPTEVAPPGREKQVKALKGKVDNPYAVAWSSYNKSKGKKEAIGDELTDEGGFGDIDTAKKEKARLYALLKDKKELYNAAMAGQGGGVGREEELEDEIEQIQKALGIGEATQPELPGMTPQIDNTPMGTKMFLDMGKKLDINFDQDQSSMVQGVLNTLDQEALATAVDTYKRQNLDPDQAESKELNTEAMKKPVTEDKKPVKEAITMSADSPEEAGMLMQIMKLAGVQQVTPDMLGAEEPAAEVPADNDADHDHNNDGEQDHAPEECPVCGNDGGDMRNMMSKVDDREEPAEETYSNTPDEKVQDTDTLVNVHSGGLNKQKQQVRKEYPGDNPLAVKEDPTEEELSNSLRNQYEGFKKSYQEATKVAETKGKDQDKDGDVDSKDYKKSKDIAIKKAMAKK